MSIKKLTPSSVYDYHKLELWLNNMAAEGLLLEDNGYKNTYAKFAESEPVKHFHRIWPKDSMNNYGDAREHRKSFGWEYVASSTDYDIYRSADEDSLLIDNDDKNDYFVSKAIKRRKLFKILECLFTFIAFIFFSILCPYIIISIPQGLWISVLIFLTFILDIIKCFRNIHLIQKFKNREKSEESNMDWKKSKISHQIPNFLSIVLYSVFFIILILSESTESIKQSLPDNSSSIPFATVDDFVADRAFYSLDNSIINTYERWKTPVTTQNYEWNEKAKILNENGQEIKCYLLVDYHKAKHPIIAKMIAELYYTEIKLSRYTENKIENSDVFGFDFEKKYLSEIGFESYILQNGNDVIRFSIDCTKDNSDGESETVPAEKYVEIIAESIR